MKLKDFFIAPTPEERAAREREASALPTRTATGGITPRPRSSTASYPEALSTPPPPTRSEPLLPLSIGAPRAPHKSTAPAVSAPSEPDPKFLAMFQKELKEKSTVAGFEEFVDQLDVIDDDVPDRGTAIKMTIKSLDRVHGIKLPQLVASMRERLKTIESLRAFLEQRLAEESRQATVDRRQAVETANAHVAELERQLEEARRTKAAAEQAAGELSSMVSGVRMGIESAYQPLAQQLQQLISEIGS